MNWFPLWNEVLLSRKIQSLPAESFKAWINLLCLACKRDDGGVLPCIEDIAFALRLDEERTREILDQLVTRGLIERDKDALKIHDWEDWQLPSYNSTERVRKHRERTKKQAATSEQPSGNGHETLHETPGNVSETGGNQTQRSCNDLELELELEREEPPLPPLVSNLGPEYRSVGDHAMTLSADLSWGAWVDRMGHSGHAAQDIRAAIDEASAVDKLRKPYVASILKRWATDGRPKGRASPATSTLKPIVYHTARHDSIHPKHRKPQP